MSDWTRIEILLPDVDEERIDIASGALFEIGAQGLELQDTQHPPALVAAFPPDVEAAALTEAVRVALAEAGIEVGQISQRSFEPIDWSTHWRKHFKPLAFGRLWVVPSWLDAPKEAGSVLWIDPSMAFGTGLHATTSLCLERVVELGPVEKMLDVGTGTGILALGSLKMGTGRAVGVDNDPDAITVATENAMYNGLDKSLALSLELPDETFPLVVANILAKPLMEMAPSLSQRVAAGGRLLLSGVLKTQADDVVAAYADLKLDVVTQRDEWVRIEMIRASATS